MNRFASIAMAAILVTACSAASPTGPKVLNVKGVWIGDWTFDPASAGHGMFSMTLTQDGTNLAGAVQLTGLDRTSPSQVRGTLKQDVVHIVGVAASGTLKVTANEMTGVIHYEGQTAHVIARRQTD